MKKSAKLNQKIKAQLEASGLKQAWKRVVTKGNLWAVAIGLLVGAAFGALVNSLANDIIMQAIANLFHYKGVNYMSFGTTKWERLPVYDPTAPNKVRYIRGLPLNGIMYGKFIGALISFVIVVGFMVLVTWITSWIWSRMRRKQIITDPQAVPMTTDQLILAELQKLNANLSLPAVKKSALRSNVTKSQNNATSSAPKAKSKKQNKVN